MTLIQSVKQLLTINSLRAKRRACYPIENKGSSPRIQSIFKTDWIWETDHLGKLTYASNAVTAILGYAPQEITGSYLYSFIPGNVSKHVKKKILDVKQKPGAIEDLRYQMIGKDGRVVCLITNAVPLYNKHNRFSGFRGLSKDITDIQRSGSDTTDIEIRLIETELFLRQCQFLATIGHWKFNLQTKQLSWSDVLYRIFNVSKDAFTPTYEGRLDLIHPEDRNRVLYAYQKHLKDHEAYNIRYRIATPNRAIKHVHETCETHFDSYNRPLYSLGTVRDITSQIITLKKLEESEFKFDDLYENAVVGYYRTTPCGNILMANPTLAEMLGYSSVDELKQRPLNDDCYASTKPRSVFIEQIEQTGKVIDLESIWYKKDGSKLYVSESARAIYNDKGEIDYFDGTVVDITSRKEAQEAVTISNILYKSLFDNANDAILIMKKDTLIDCNNKTLEIFGCTKIQLLNESMYRFCPPQQPDGANSREKTLALLDLAQKGIPQAFEWKHLRYDGTPFDSEVSLNKLDLSSAVYIQAIVRDISQRKKHEAKINKLNRQLEEEIQKRTKALEKSEQKFNDISELLPNTIFEIDLKGNFTYINKHGQKLLGVSNLDVAKTAINLLNVIPLKYHKKLKECISQKLNGLNPLPKEYYIVDYKGEERPVIIHSTVILKGEQPTGIRGIIIEQAMCSTEN